MDSQARIVSCFRAAIGDLKLAERNDQQLSNVIGLGFREALLSLYPEVNDCFHDDLVERYRHYFLHEDKTPSALFSGARDLLEDLSRQEYFIAIATGKGRAGLDRALAESKLDTFFHASRCADEARSKPDPQMLDELMDYFAVEPEQTIMIGDTEYDLHMAQNAKTQSIGVTHGVHEQKRLEKFNPITCVPSINDLHVWLGRNLINGSG